MDNGNQFQAYKMRANLDWLMRKSLNGNEIEIFSQESP
jgi:hypothetical protein